MAHKTLTMMIQFDHTLFIVLLGTTLVGLASGIMGCFVILQRQSLFGDAIAHATLPGLAGMFLYTGSKVPLALFSGATLSGALGAYFIHLINQHTTLKKETSLGIILSTTFGLGTVFLSIIQTYPTAHKAGINKFLLGNAATLLWQDLTLIFFVTALVITTVTLFWKECKIYVFNKEFAHTIGLNTYKINIILTTLTVITIIVGLQTVGVVLISSLLIAPASAAYQWTNRLSSMIFISCLFSCLATTTGTLISCSCSHLPTGPTIIIVATLITFASILCAPQHGIIYGYLKKQNQLQHIDAEKMLANFMLFNESKTDPFHAHDLQALQAIGKKSTEKTLHFLASQNLITSKKKNFWNLTPNGFKAAAKLHKKYHPQQQSKHL